MGTPYTFQADTRALKKLCDAALSSMKAARTAHEKDWVEIRDNFEPEIARALDEGDNASDRAAGRRNSRIKNSEPRILLHRLAAGLQSGITNQSQRWLALITLDTAAAERGPVKAFLSASTDRILDAMARGNLYTTLDRVYLHEPAFGSSCFVVVTGDHPGDIHQELVDEGDYWIEENRRGRVDRMIRRIPMTASKMIEEFGEGWVPESVRDAAKACDAHTERAVYNYIRPNDGRKEFGDIGKGRAFVSVYWTDGASADENDGILAVRAFDYNPIIAPRWATNGSVYGFGPGKIGLDDAKQLQSMENDKLQIIAQEATPTLEATSDLKGSSALDNYPGGVVWTKPDTQGGQRVKRLIDSHPSIEGVLKGIADTSQRLNRIFYSDLLAMMLNMTGQSRQMTAREVAELSNEKVALLGPILSRMNTDLLDPLVDAYFAILFKAGALPPPPPEMEGLPLGVAYSSALHVEQKRATKMQGLTMVLETVGMVAKLQPSALDKFNGDQAIDVALEATPESADVILDDDKVDKLRADRARDAQAREQAAAAAAALPHIGRTAKDLSEAKLGNGSILDAAQQAMRPTGGQA